MSKLNMSKQSMLVVDDSRLSRLMVKSFTEKCHPTWEIDEAADANDAIEVSVNKDYSHITVDYNMPGMNGIDLIGLLKNKFPDAKIALITANIQNTLKSESEEMGVSFISKPITEEKIISFVG
ncbi:MAG: response regulator [Enterobacterales bacterium]|nr:response regulator [Enterobacterales bacterium]